MTTQKVERSTTIRLKFCRSAPSRARQMNSGAELASHEILVFLHADTRLEPGWLKELGQLKYPFWGAFTPIIDDQGLLFRLAEIWGRTRSHLSGIPYGDQCIFVKRDFFEKIGRFDTNIDFMEELELSRTLNRKYGKPAIMSSGAITSARRWKETGKGKVEREYLHSLKNLVVFLGFISGIPRDKLKKWYLN